MSSRIHRLFSRSILPLALASAQLALGAAFAGEMSGKITDKSVQKPVNSQFVGLDEDQLFHQARSLARQYKHKEADIVLDELVKRQPRTAKYRLLLARGLSEEGRFPRALEQLFEASLLEPNDSEAYFQIAQIYVYQGRFKDAVAVLEQIKKRSGGLSGDSRMADVAIQSIAAYYQLGDPHSPSYADPGEDMIFQRSDFPVKVAIWSDPELPQLKGPFKQAVIDAFTKWREASGGWLRYEITDDQRKAKIVCKLVQVMRGSAHEGGGMKLGETLADYDHKNADFRGSSRVEIFWDEDSNPNHLRHVVLHEVGHSLGLGHSNNTLDVMYPVVHPPYVQYPSKRDGTSLRTLYKLPL
jgi:predicted Zn-dependent protease